MSPIKLTRKQAEVAELVAAGMSSKEIGERLFISISGVAAHRHNIRAKLGIKGDVDLSEYLRSTGWYL